MKWVGHPNWYFRISKHSLPFLKTEHTAPAFFADEFPADEKIDNYVLKPLYSFAGLGVDMEPTREKLSALKNPREWILQKKVRYAEFVPTPDGPKSKAEIRMMFLWPENNPDPTLVNNLVRMSQGKNDGRRFQQRQNLGRLQHRVARTRSASSSPPLLRKCAPERSRNPSSLSNYRSKAGRATGLQFASVGSRS